MTPCECPNCYAMFWHLDALAEHRKRCKVWAGNKPKPKEEEDKPDQYDTWAGIK